MVYGECRRIVFKKTIINNRNANIGQLMKWPGWWVQKYLVRSTESIGCLTTVTESFNIWENLRREMIAKDHRKGGEE